MNFLHFESFLTTAEHKSITSAAKKLYITPTALMQQINLFEEELGFKVFFRSPKGVSLTQAGKLLYEGCLELKHESNALFQRCKDVANREKQLIRISVTRPYYLFELCKQYSAENPTIQFDYDLIDPLIQGSLEMHFTQDNFDMIQTGEDPTSTNSLPYEIISYPADRFCCVCDPSHSFSQLKSIPLKMLDGIPLHTYSNYSIDLPKMEKLADSLGIHISLHRSLYSEREVLRCCANHGVYVLQEQATKFFPTLTAIPIEPTIPCSLGLAYMKNAKPAVQRFAQYVREHMDIIAAQYE